MGVESVLCEREVGFAAEVQCVYIYICVFLVLDVCVIDVCVCVCVWVCVGVCVRVCVCVCSNETLA